MARVTGPLHSDTASGQLGKVIVFSRWRARPYVRAYVIPTNPKTAAQESNRAVVQFLSQKWAAIDIAEQNTWLTLAAQANYSTFNAYMKANLDRWAQFQAPSKFTPITEAGTLPIIIASTAVGGVGLVTVQTDNSMLEAGWGILIFRSLDTGFTPDKSNLVHVNLSLESSPVAWINDGLAPDTYFYNFINFTDDGKLGTAEGEISATVT